MALIELKNISKKYQLGSQEVEALYTLYNNINEFSKALVNNEFRIAVAQIIILLKYNRFAEFEKVYMEVKNMMSPSYTGKLYGILRRHKYTETLKVTPEVKRFLKKIKIIE